MPYIINEIPINLIPDVGDEVIRVPHRVTMNGVQQPSLFVSNISLQNSVM